MLCMALALLFALQVGLVHLGTFTALGAVLALGYFVRPTNAVPLFAFGVWALVKHRAFVTRYVVGASVVAVAFLAANLARLRAAAPALLPGEPTRDHADGSSSAARPTW